MVIIGAWGASDPGSNPGKPIQRTNKSDAMKKVFIPRTAYIFMQKNSLLFFIFIASMLTIAQTAFAQCTVNGKNVPCDQFFSAFGWIFVIMLIVFLAFGIFWLWMLIDCIQRDFKDKVLWIIILLFASFIGAIIYFFVVKKKINRKNKKRAT